MRQQKYEEALRAILHHAKLLQRDEQRASAMGEKVLSDDTTAVIIALAEGALEPPVK